MKEKKENRNGKKMKTIKTSTGTRIFYFFTTRDLVKKRMNVSERMKGGKRCIEEGGGGKEGERRNLQKRKGVGGKKAVDEKGAESERKHVEEKQVIEEKQKRNPSMLGEKSYVILEKNM